MEFFIFVNNSYSMNIHIFTSRFKIFEIPISNTLNFGTKNIHFWRKKNVSKIKFLTSIFGCKNLNILMSTSTNLVVKTFYTYVTMNFFTIKETLFAASASSLSTVTVHIKDFSGRSSIKFWFYIPLRSMQTIKTTIAYLFVV